MTRSRRRIPALLLMLAAVPPLAVQAAHADTPGRQHDRHIAWKRCAQSPDDAVGGELDRAGAQCAQITVPLDHARPDGRTIKIALSRLKATDRAHRIGTMVLNSGGPAEPTLGMPLETRTYLKQVASRFDLIGLDPRFVGRSTPLDCGWPIGLWLRSAGSDRAGFDRQVAFQRDLAERCRRGQGDVLPYVTTRDTARDIDLVRRALGERKISFLGYSYGAYLGAVYTQMFPGRTDRVVLDSAGDPRTYGPRLMQGTEDEAEHALRAWASWAAEHHDVYGLGQTRRQVLATVRRITDTAAERPLKVGPYLVDEHALPQIIYVGSAADRPADRAEFASTVRVLNEAANGRAATPNEQLDGLLAFLLTSANSQYGSAAAAIICGDRAAPRDPETYWNDVQRSRSRHPLFGPLKNNIWPCAFWPGSPREQPTRIGNPTPALIVSATGDAATTYQGGKAMHRLMTGSRLLTLDAVAHGIYGEYGDPCVDAKVNTYLATRTLPPGDERCPAIGRR
ncbi:alpha/beta hydrolase [Spirillospora sp. CA-128828]|uniref:alpha/beta hydrolase n=1 Tax=Spirillospora sp. CA-128828 TaxID=3240033 RepID=UPI003D9121E0